MDCVSLNENILESELFGHAKGSFTGADRLRIGRFEDAHEGDIFLDEIGDVPLAIQAKLLRVLEDKVVERVGEQKPIKVDVRIVTATNQDLPSMVKDGRFRQDLYYRINVVPIQLPPLRERREDIPLLARILADRQNIKTGKTIDGFTPEAMSLLYNYPWPGNVRELKNAVEYAFVVCRGQSIEPGDLPDSINKGENASVPETSASEERERLVAALKESGGNQSKAARLLGVSRMTVWKRMKKYGLQVNRDIN